MTNQEKALEGGFYDLVCADVPFPSPLLLLPPSSELMRGFLVLFLAYRSWRAVRGWRREREERGRRRRRRRGYEEDEEKREEEEGGGVVWWGFPCGLELQQHQHKAPRCEGFESWPDSRRNRGKGERRVISFTQDGTAFFDLADFKFFVLLFHTTGLWQKKKKKKKKDGDTEKIMQGLIEENETRTSNKAV